MFDLLFEVVYQVLQPADKFPDGHRATIQTARRRVLKSDESNFQSEPWDSVSVPTAAFSYTDVSQQLRKTPLR